MPEILPMIPTAELIFRLAIAGKNRGTRNQARPATNTVVTIAANPRTRGQNSSS